MWSFPGLRDISAVLSKSIPLSDEDIKRVLRCLIVVEVLCSLRARKL